MGKAPAAKGPDDIMSASEMKPILTKSKQEPVSVAFCQTEGKEGVILLSVKKSPQKVKAALIAEAKKINLKLENSSIRFGTAEVDTEVDASLVLFTINRDPPGGIEAKLKNQLKGSGCTKVDFKVDAALDAAPDEDAAADEQESAPSEAEEATSAAPPPPPGPPPAPPPPQAQKTGPDAGALAKQLAALVPQIATVAGTDKQQLTILNGLAAAAATALKGGNLDLATTSIADLKRALAAAVAPANPAQSAAGPVAYGKARLAWLAARNRMVADIEKLRGAIVATYQADGIAGDLASAFQTRVAPVMATLDEELADKLDEAINATDPVARGKLVDEAKSLIDKYSKYIAGEQLIADLDNNPFVPLAIQQVVGGTLAALSKAVH